MLLKLFDEEDDLVLLNAKIKQNSIKFLILEIFSTLGVFVFSMGNSKLLPHKNTNGNYSKKLTSIDEMRHNNSSLENNISIACFAY